MYFIAMLGVIAFFISIIALIKGNFKLLKINSRKQALLFLVLSFVWIVVFSPSTVDTETQSEANVPDSPGGPSLEELQTFEGTLDMKVDGNKVIMTVDSNAPDGGIFELNLLNSSFDMLSENVAIQNGKIEHAFDIPEEWGVGNIAGAAWFRFNGGEFVVQPDSVKDLYGENGENMKGEQAEENNVGGYNGMIDSVAIAFPDEETVREVTNKLFAEGLQELIDLADGVILDIQPDPDQGWKMVYVFISDAWYASAEHEKERFAEQVAENIKALIFSAEMVEGNYAGIYFKDSYGKDLATPKTFGGYNIKR